MSGPKYRHTADAIKTKIASGEVAGEITLGRIRELTGATDSTARRAANELVAEGVLENHPGSPYSIVATPAEAIAKRASLDALSEEMAVLREQVGESGQGDLLARVDRLETNLILLYGMAGFEYPDDDAKTATGRGRRR